jgi:predicted Rossmann-fold nucleotide-binding protein
MKIIFRKRGECVSAPLRSVNVNKGSGWGIMEVPSDGILVTLDDSEKQSGGIFVSTEELEKVGYKFVGDKKDE